MDFLAFVNDDHEVIYKFIKEIESADSYKIKEKIFNEMLIFLKAYFRAIETSLYLRSIKTNIFELKELAQDGYEEHRLIEDLAYRAKNSKYDENIWKSRIKDFCQVVELHLAAEATDYYSNLKDFFSPIELERVAVSYLKEKKLELAMYEYETQENVQYFSSMSQESNLN